MGKRILPTPEQLREMLDYDKDSGVLVWKKCDFRSNAWNGKYPGKHAITSDSGCGYRKGEVMGCTVYAHRIAWAIVHGEWPSGEIDHINGNSLDNRLVNLREASSSENSMNQKGHKDSLSGLKGAGWHAQRGRWVSSIFAKGKRYHLGLFDSPQEAHEAYCKAAKEIHGSFARLS